MVSAVQLSRMQLLRTQILKSKYVAIFSVGFSHLETPQRRPPNRHIRSHDKLVSTTESSFSESTDDTASDTEKCPTAANQRESVQESSTTVKAPKMNGHDYLGTLFDKQSFQNFKDLTSNDPDSFEFFVIPFKETLKFD